MKIQPGIWIFSFLLTTNLYSQQVQLTSSSVLKFASIKESSELLGSRDEYVVQMSSFDRAARMHSPVPVSEEDILAHLKKQAMQWLPQEIAMFRGFVEDYRTALQQYDLNFPATVLLVKSTSQEEGGAGVAYTRMNAIVFTSKMLQNKEDMLEKVFLHELFHILSRHNPELQVRLYGLIGFERCNSIELPAKLANRKLTNPDAPRNDNYIEVSYKGENITVIPFIFANQAVYDPDKGRTIFDFLELRLLRVQKQEGVWQVVLDNGDAELLGVQEVDGFFDKIGKNTQYIIHPEEILAENFVYMVTEKKNLPTPEIVNGMRMVLQK